MRIDRGDAIELESIVRKVFSCDRAGMGEHIDIDHFESVPFDAASIVLTPLQERADFHETEDLLFEWEESLCSENGRNTNIVSYINELENLVTALMQRQIATMFKPNRIISQYSKTQT